jgi:rhamnose utilization protein RhaD (predicted bifunctional aldolase and dehydrogenase)/NAD(P)-dependent dehydrogenase (short-subunit alcohol dehydrogenase family)
MLPLTDIEHQKRSETMENRWNDADVARHTDDLALRVYTSRLLGADPALVLHGGGNTSVKIVETDLFGEEEEILYVKGSGWDLGSIEKAGFAPVRMERLLKLARLSKLSDPQMVNELKTAMTDAAAPGPSVEAILHAILPFKFVDHTHADAFVTVSNTPGGADRVRELYGDRVVYVPYVMPGFDLARTAFDRFSKERTDKTIGMALMNHGVFSFGDTAKESYDRMIELVGMAEEYLKTHNAWGPVAEAPPPATFDREAFADLRRRVSAAAGRPMILRSNTGPKQMGFVTRSDLSTVAQQGPATPDHVIRTKRLPMIGGEAVEAYVADYRAYFETAVGASAEPKTMLDPAPRVILDPAFGVVAAETTVKGARIIDDILDHTIDVVSRATLLGGYAALSAQDIFDVEYWDLEQAKLRTGGKAPIFTGEAALVTGGAAGIGAACVDALLARGAAVAALDVNPAVTDRLARPDYLGIVCDLTDEAAVATALDTIVAAFGGLDMAILNAGIFTPSTKIEALSLDLWRKVFAINTDANVTLLRLLKPLLAAAPNGGRVTIVGSKNVPAPGPGAGAYSASKAALTQLGRVAALEWGAENIRVNTLHPDAVFDTGIWTDELIANRAKAYGMTPAAYKTKNVLKTEVKSADVGALAAESLGPLFAKTTGAAIPIDGGNDRVI